MAKFVPTDEQKYSVGLMAGIGIRHTDIASALGVSENTLRSHFRDELSTGKTKTITKVADSLVRQALAGNITAAIFYLKTQAGWRDSASPVEAAVGKKEQATRAAKSAAKDGNPFAPPAPPKLLINNG